MPPLTHFFWSKLNSVDIPYRRQVGVGTVGATGQKQIAQLGCLDLLKLLSHSFRCVGHAQVQVLRGNVAQKPFRFVVQICSKRNTSASYIPIIIVFIT